MTAACISLLLGVAALFCHVIIVPLVLRGAPQVAPVVVHLGSAAGIHLAQIATTLMTGHVLALSIPYWHGVAMLGFGAIGYLFVFSAVYKSISLRMLAVLIKQPQGKPLSVSGLTEAVMLPEFEQRVSLLLNGKLAVDREDTYSVTVKGRTLADRLTRLQRAFGVARSGLY